MRICVLSPSYEGSDSPFAGLDPACDPGRHMGHRPDLVFEAHPILQGRAMAQVSELIRSRRYDLFFNLCDGAWDEDRPGMAVVRLLERHRVAYTGADPCFYAPTRETMKKVAVYEGVPTPPFVFVHAPARVEEETGELSYPLIVKPPDGYSSIGIGPDALCWDRDSLLRQARRTIDRFGGALVEEFVEGREATVLVAEDPSDRYRPLALVPVECAFPPGERFKHFDLKWHAYQGLGWAAVPEPELADRLRDLARRMFVALGGVSYARCDFRIDRSGEPSFLEINPNCGIFYPPDAPGSADVVLELDPLGADGFIERVIEAAMARAERRGTGGDPVAVRYSREDGYGLRAVRRIEEGERILTYEEGPHHLVSRGHVEGRWDETRRKALARFGYPLTDGLFVMWSDDPDRWRPINHSCDPNAWLGEGRGLDVFARRSVAAGEEITMDYATFSGPWMAPFSCRCGSDSCRGTIRGTDAPGAWLFERYGSRVSEYLWERRSGRRGSSEARSAG